MGPQPCNVEATYGSKITHSSEKWNISRRLDAMRPVGERRETPRWHGSETAATY
jgi:hypothetical protein